MSPQIKAAIIIGLSIAISVFIFRYMSPYSDCVRHLKKTMDEPQHAVAFCSKHN